MFDLSHLARATTLARHVDDLSIELTQYTQHLTRATFECGWAGPAAEAFHRSAHEALLRVRLTTERLERAADALRRHGQAGRAALERAPR